MNPVCSFLAHIHPGHILLNIRPITTVWTHFDFDLTAKVFHTWTKCVFFSCIVYKCSFILQPEITKSQWTVNLSWVEITTSGLLSQNDKHPKFHRRLNRRLTAFNLSTAARRFRKSLPLHLKNGVKKKSRTEVIALWHKLQNREAKCEAHPHILLQPGCYYNFLLCACTCVSISNMSSPLSRLHFFFSPPHTTLFIDLNTVTLKGSQKCGSTKQELNPSFTSEGRPWPWMVALSTQRWQPGLALLPGGLNLSGTEGSAKNIKSPRVSQLFGLVHTSHLSFLPPPPPPPPLPGTVTAFGFKRVIVGRKKIERALKQTIFFSFAETFPIFPLSFNSGCCSLLLHASTWMDRRYTGCWCRLPFIRCALESWPPVRHTDAKTCRYKTFTLVFSPPPPPSFFSTRWIITSVHVLHTHTPPNCAAARSLKVLLIKVQLWG